MDWASLLSSASDEGGESMGYSVDTNASANTNVATGPFTQGFTFGGINTGKQTTMPSWTLPALIGLAVVGFFLWKK